jgi:CBS domain containing-hemolysin-like protein
MITTLEPTILGRMLRPMTRGMSLELARELVALKAEEETQQHYEMLADGRREGTLSPEQEAELQNIVQVNSVLSMLKAEARLMLAGVKA